MEERLQKLLARAGFASRRGAETLMEEGRVTVNGEVVKELGTKADAARDDIRVDGVRVKAAREPVHLVLHKPRGVVTTRSDPSGRPTVMSLVPDVPGLFPVGRLDLTTEGLILLTNDGAFAERVAHPRFEVPRVYHAKVRGVPDAQALGRLRRGVRVKGEVMAVDRVRIVTVDRHAWVEVTLHEGKQHEVKRLLEAVGHPVSKLRRVAFGPVTLRGLEPGQFRALTPGEVAGLLRGEQSRKTPAPRTRRRPRLRPTGKGTSAKGATKGKATPRDKAGPAPRGREDGAERGARGRKAASGPARTGRGATPRTRTARGGAGRTTTRGSGSGSTAGRGATKGRGSAKGRGATAARGATRGRGATTGRVASKGRGGGKGTGASRRRR